MPHSEGGHSRNPSHDIGHGAGDKFTVLFPVTEAEY